ncbi:hypothetical protein [Altererythrobacter sp. MF3-039]|uniref:hypothetical protein n=1 Tax=Altererythrobacter sp. MF3-039 TaxID=3252901 RepID=UPI00390C5781
MAATLMPAQVQAKPTACDYAAAHPDDPDKVLPGFERSEIDLAAAETTCREVLEEMPDHARTNYLLGRVLFYQQRQNEALPFLEAAEDAGYRQSIFVLGYIDKEGFIESADACRGLDRLRRGVSLEHPWSGYHVVDGTLSGKFDDCDSPPERAELQRAMALVSENVTVAASEGRVEALMRKLADAEGSEG